jgi:hypothetical protein
VALVADLAAAVAAVEAVASVAAAAVAAAVVGPAAATRKKVVSPVSENVRSNCY